MRCRLCEKVEVAYRLKRHMTAKIFKAERDLEVSLETHHKQNLEMCNS